MSIGIGQVQGRARKSSQWVRIRARIREVQEWAQVNEQRSSGRDQESESLRKYHLEEGQAPTAASHSTGLSLDISVIKIGPEPRVPNLQEGGDVLSSMTVQLLKVLKYQFLERKMKKRMLTFLKEPIFTSFQIILGCLSKHWECHVDICCKFGEGVLYSSHSVLP